MGNVLEMLTAVTNNIKIAQDILKQFQREEASREEEYRALVGKNRELQQQRSVYRQEKKNIDDEHKATESKCKKEIQEKAQESESSKSRLGEVKADHRERTKELEETKRRIKPIQDEIANEQGKQKVLNQQIEDKKSEKERVDQTLEDFNELENRKALCMMLKNGFLRKGDFSKSLLAELPASLSDEFKKKLNEYVASCKELEKQEVNM